MPKMPEIKIGGRALRCEEGTSLLDVLLANEIYIDNACGGMGKCGKCRVRITEGTPEPVSAERELLKAADIAAGVRLACFVDTEKDMTVEVLSEEKSHDVLTAGKLRSFEFKPGIFKRPVILKRPTLEDQTPFEEQILEQTGALRMDFAALQSGRFVPGTVTAVLDGDTVVALESGDTTDRLYGVAIDIGTTTVVCALVDMLTGEELGTASMINAQKAYGLDVLTRITYELDEAVDGANRLREAIVGSINDMVAEVCAKQSISQNEIYEFTVGANCTMMHMLLGVDATAIGKAPYAPMFRNARKLAAASIGLKAGCGAGLYCLPSVSAYIGADIVAGAYVCELEKADGNVLFIDIGTNGEIVLSCDGKLLSCSCAAGPALEGMNISSGMRASEGAIEDVNISENGVSLSVIGGREAVGLCGSGILAVVRELLKAGFIRKNGAFVKADSFGEDDFRSALLRTDTESGKREFIVKGEPAEILITQSDVRQVQLAKGAILSGFKALLAKAGLEMEDLDRVMIAGQFGAHLPAESLTGTGLLPEEVGDRLEYVGNSSKAGAYMALMSDDVKREMEALARSMDYMELGATENYERLFSECLLFPEYK